MSKFLVITQPTATEITGRRYLVSATPADSYKAARESIREHFRAFAKADHEAHSNYSFARGIVYRVVSAKPEIEIHTDDAGDSYISLDDAGSLATLEMWDGTTSKRIGKSVMFKATSELRRL